MSKNREIAKMLFGEMRKIGYVPYSIKYGDGYFVFERGKDSVIHFRLKGVWRHWKFGMWINSEFLEEQYREEEKNLPYNQLYKVVQIFAQYDTQIDKFKPSASALCVSYNAYEWEKHIDGSYKYPWNQLESMLNMIKRHPFMCYAGHCGYCAGFYSGSFIWEFIRYEGLHTLEKTNEFIQTAFWVPWTKIKIYFAQKNKCIDNVVLYDFEKENPGWSTSYKYEVRITFKENVSDEEMCKWLDFWFRRDKYGKYTVYCSVIELGSFKQVGNDAPFSFS